eukprot:1160430-Pelagomonas_calceolata.AAC.3
MAVSTIRRLATCGEWLAFWCANMLTPSVALIKPTLSTAPREESCLFCVGRCICSLYVAKDDNGIVSREKIRAQYDGSVWVG